MTPTPTSLYTDSHAAARDLHQGQPGMNTCAHCNTPTRGATTCTRCRHHALHALRTIETCYEALNPHISRTGRGRRAPGFGSRPPAREDICVARDPRTPNGLLGALTTWTRLISFERDIHQQPKISMPRETQFLRAHHTWSCQQPWASRYLAALDLLAEQAKRLAGFTPPAAIGPCLYCHGLVYPAEDETIACANCHHIYDAAELVRWRLLQERARGGDDGDHTRDHVRHSDPTLARTTRHRRTHRVAA